MPLLSIPNNNLSLIIKRQNFSLFLIWAVFRLAHFIDPTILSVTCFRPTDGPFAQVHLILTTLRKKKNLFVSRPRRRLRRCSSHPRSRAAAPPTRVARASTPPVHVARASSSPVRVSRRRFSRSRAGLRSPLLPSARRAEEREGAGAQQVGCVHGVPRGVARPHGERRAGCGRSDGAVCTAPPRTLPRFFREVGTTTLAMVHGIADASSTKQLGIGIQSNQDTSSDPEKSPW